MKFPGCDQENAITAAAHSASLSPEQLLHARTCATCEAVLIAMAALESEADALVSLRPLDASVVWRRAQQRAREKALARATLPIRIALACTFIFTAFSMPWIVSALLRWMPSFEFLKLITPWDHSWLATISGTAAIGITATLICIALSSLVVLREH